MALLSAIANFTFNLYALVWAILIIALGERVIWALAVHGGEVGSV